MVKISRFQFFLISVLILLLPLSSNWKLFLFGEKTKGVVVGVRHNLARGSSSYTASLETVSVIRFSVGENYYEFYGPGEVIYHEGKEITVFYNPKNPEKFLMFNFAGIFLSSKVIIPGVLFLVWVAFYLSINQSQQKKSTHRRLEEYKHKLLIYKRFRK
jgi:hypothetical protein